MLFTLNKFPSDWIPAPLCPIMAARISYDRMRARGLRPTTGDDELGRYDEAILTIGRNPFVMQRYTSPEREDFSVFVPLVLAQDRERLQELAGVFVIELSIAREDVTWAKEGLEELTYTDDLMKHVEQRLANVGEPVDMLHASFRQKLGTSSATYAGMLEQLRQSRRLTELKQNPDEPNYPLFGEPQP